MVQPGLTVQDARASYLEYALGGCDEQYKPERGEPERGKPKRGDMDRRDTVQGKVYQGVQETAAS